MPNIESRVLAIGISASEQDNMELCKDYCRPATMYNVDSNGRDKKRTACKYV